MRPACKALQSVTNLTQFGLHPYAIGHTLALSEMKLICLNGIAEEEPMNNLHNKIDAAASAQFFGRYSFVRRFAAGMLVAGAAMSAAHAGPGDNDAQRAMQAQRAERQLPPPDRQERARQFDTRQFDARTFEARAEEQRRQLQMQQEQNQQNADSYRRGGRLTPDERRDLRRQINEAGMDLYPKSPRR